MNRRGGFTLIELVMVIVILGILAAMVIPRFVDLQTKAKESASKGSLGAIRAAVAVKYASNIAYGATSEAAAIPSDITASMFQDNKVPDEPISGTNEVTAGSTPDGSNSGWLYDSTTGRVWVNHSSYSTW